MLLLISRKGGISRVQKRVFKAVRVLFKICYDPVSNSDPRIVQEDSYAVFMKAFEAGSVAGRKLPKYNSAMTRFKKERDSFLSLSNEALLSARGLLKLVQESG